MIIKLLDYIFGTRREPKWAYREDLIENTGHFFYNIAYTSDGVPNVLTVTNSRNLLHEIDCGHWDSRGNYEIMRQLQGAQIPEFRVHTEKTGNSKLTGFQQKYQLCNIRNRSQ
jgi:hypothetical protein